MAKEHELITCTHQVREAYRQFKMFLICSTRPVNVNGLHMFKCLCKGCIWLSTLAGFCQEKFDTQINVNLDTKLCVLTMFTQNLPRVALVERM